MIDPREEILDSIQIMVNKAIKAETTKIYTATVTNISGANRCDIILNNQTYTVQYYGDIPIVNNQYRVFVPFGEMPQAFIITGGGSTPANGGNADTVGGLSVHTGVNNEANKIMRTDSNGYANFGWMQTTSGQLGGKPAGVWVKSGNWLYYQTTDDFILNCGIATKAEVGDMATALSIISGVDK